MECGTSQESAPAASTTVKEKGKLKRVLPSDDCYYHGEKKKSAFQCVVNSLHTKALLPEELNVAFSKAVCVCNETVEFNEYFENNADLLDQCSTMTKELKKMKGARKATVGPFINQLDEYINNGTITNGLMQFVYSFNKVQKKDFTSLNERYDELVEKSRNKNKTLQECGTSQESAPAACTTVKEKGKLKRVLPSDDCYFHGEKKKSAFQCVVNSLHTKALLPEELNVAFSKAVCVCNETVEFNEYFENKADLWDQCSTMTKELKKMKGARKATVGPFINQLDEYINNETITNGLMKFVYFFNKVQKKDFTSLNERYDELVEQSRNKNKTLQECGTSQESAPAACTNVTEKGKLKIVLPSEWSDDCYFHGKKKKSAFQCVVNSLHTKALLPEELNVAFSKAVCVCNETVEFNAYFENEADLLDQCSKMTSELKKRKGARKATVGPLINQLDEYTKHGTITNGLMKFVYFFNKVQKKDFTSLNERYDELVEQSRNKNKTLQECGTSQESAPAACTTVTEKGKLKIVLPSEWSDDCYFHGKKKKSAFQCVVNSLHTKALLREELNVAFSKAVCVCNEIVEFIAYFENRADLRSQCSKMTSELKERKGARKATVGPLINQLDEYIEHGTITNGLMQFVYVFNKVQKKEFTSLNEIYELVKQSRNTKKH